MTSRGLHSVGLSRLTPIDLWSESVVSAFARPARAALTALGTVLGITALVATVGLSRTAGRQIVDTFDRLAATEVDISSVSTGALDSSGAEIALQAIPWDAQERLERLRGVRAAGTATEIASDPPLRVSAVPVRDPARPETLPPDLIAVSPGFLDAAGATLATGRWFDRGHSDRADHVALVGALAARELGITRVDQQPGIFIGDEVFAVIGIIDSVRREKGLLSSVVLPEGTARDLYSLPGPQRALADTDLGASTLIAGQAPVALAPNSPELVEATPGWSPSGARRGVQNDVTGLLLILGGVALLVGVVGIANVTLVSVLERVGEIGLRRALGAGRRHIAAQFLTESMVIGLLAGVIGSALGVVAVVVVSAGKQWTPVLDPWLPFAAVAGGALAGLLAGAYPAWRASRLEPVDALRAGT